MSPEFSLVIPAYNEAQRLPPYLVSMRAYLDRSFAHRYEVLVVDDGSQDGLADLVEGLRPEWPQLVLLRDSRNRGKGRAVRLGILASRGDYILFADADGATPIEEECRLRHALRQGADVAIGSRLLPGSSMVCHRVWHRGLAGQLFARVACRALGLPLQDTQCGFKMFRRDVAHRLFSLSQESSYLFDLEILALAQLFGYRIAELPVSWTDKPGSKVRLVRDGWRMLRGLWRLRRSLGDRRCRLRS